VRRRGALSGEQADEPAVTSQCISIDGRDHIKSISVATRPQLHHT
jgi:hypothetical protein